MRTTICNTCEAVTGCIADECIIEVDERSIKGMRSLLTEDVASIQCGKCGRTTGCTPAIVVWIDRRTRAACVKGGPWSDGKRTTDVWPQLADVEITNHDSLAGLRSTMDARYVKWLDLLQEAIRQCWSNADPAWFDMHHESLGAEIYVAALLAQEHLLSAGLTLASTETDAALKDIEELVGLVQSRACFAMCTRWQNYGFDGRRLQDCIDAIVYQSAVSKTTLSRFAAVLEQLLSGKISEPLKIACEITYAWLCACSGVTNRRAESFTQAVFDLENFATEAGGNLPLQAHACRLDPDRLAAIVDPGALEAAVSTAHGPSIDCLIETARRLGHPEAAKHLVRTPIPAWLAALRSPETIATQILSGPEGEIQLTADGVLHPTNLMTGNQPSADSETQQHEIFISYSSRDRLKADVIARYLRAIGIEVFMDHHTSAGDLWTRKIPQQLSSCQLVLVLWSRDSIHSRWVIKEAETALARGVLVQVLLAPVDIPKQFADIQWARLEAWSNEADDPRLASLGDNLCKKLGREPDSPAAGVVNNAIRQFKLVEVAEAVFDLCNANAWHAIAPISGESLSPVGPAYAKLKAALEPATDTTLHELLNRFDLARILLLIAITTVDADLSELSLSLPPPFKVTRHTGGAAVDCRSAQVTKASLLDALHAMPGVVTHVSDRLAAPTADVFRMPNGVTVEVSAHLDNPAVIAAVALRSGSSSRRTMP